MACAKWKSEWVAQLYQELSAGEERELKTHLEHCDDCRETLRDLADSRQALQSSAPRVPDAPRVLLLEPQKPATSRFWTFAAGAAAAVFVFALGLGAASLFETGLGQPVERSARADVAEAAALSELDTRVSAMEQRFASYAGAAGDPSPEIPLLTRKQFDETMERVIGRLELDRARDVQFLLGEINATERRAGNWVGETREALRLVALQNDPRITQQ